MMEDPKEPEAMLTLQSTIGEDDADCLSESFGQLNIDLNGRDIQGSLHEILAKVADEITQEEDIEALGRALEVSQSAIDQAKDENNDGLESTGTYRMMRNRQGTLSSERYELFLKDSLKKAKLFKKVSGLFAEAKPKAGRKNKKEGAYGGGEFYDVYLLSNGIPADEDKILEIAHENDWKVFTEKSFKLGMGVIDSIEKALISSTYMVVLVCEKDCKEMKSERYMTIQMAFQKNFEPPFDKIIPIICCELEEVSLKFRSLRNICIGDEDLKERLERDISKSERQKREKAYSAK